MEKWPKITIVPSEKKVEKEYTLDDAARMAMEIKNNSEYSMRVCIGKVSEETGWDTKNIAKTLADWGKPKSEIETKEEKEERDIDSGLAWKDEEGRVRYYDDRESEI